MEEIKSSNYYWVVTKSVLHACWLYLAKYKPDFHGFCEQSWTLRQERFSWSWQTIRAIVQCTLKKSCCKPILLSFMASFVGVCLFVCGICVCVWFGGFLMYVWHAWFLMCVWNYSSRTFTVIMQIEDYRCQLLLHCKLPEWVLIFANKTHLISVEDEYCDSLCKELSLCCTSAVSFSVYSILLNMNYKHERESEVFRILVFSQMFCQIWSISHNHLLFLSRHNYFIKNCV